MSHTTEEIRDKVLQGFQQIQKTSEENVWAFSHLIPFREANFIDGMAWIGILSGAAKMVNDEELVNITKCHLEEIIACGKDTRNFYTHQVRDSWEQVPNTNLWRAVKKQYHAGPVGLYFAISKGVDINPDWVHKPTRSAYVMRIYSLLFGWTLKVFGNPFKNHTNSFMTASMYLGKTPPSNMKWMTKDNPFYSYLYGIKCDTEYPLRASTWPARNTPWGYKINEDGWWNAVGAECYTPVCELASRYLQSTL